MCFGKGHWQNLLILVLRKITKLCQLTLASGWFQYFKDYLKRVCCKDAQDMGLKTQMRIKTQSLHNSNWRLCPKIDSAGRETVKTVVLLSLCQSGPWLEMEGWGVLLLILPTEGRGFGCGFFLIRFLFL